MCQQCVFTSLFYLTCSESSRPPAQCYVDVGNSTRGSSLNADAVARRSIAGKSARVPRGAKATDSGAAPKTGTKTTRTCPMAVHATTMPVLVAE